jgi:hypothetical protein
MKDHEIAQLVNEATKVAKRFRDCQHLRQNISNLLVPALRDAKQTMCSDPNCFVHEGEGCVKGEPSCTNCESFYSPSAGRKEINRLRSRVAELGAKETHDLQDAKRYRWVRDRLAVEDVDRIAEDGKIARGRFDENESLKTDAAVDFELNRHDGR